MIKNVPNFIQLTADAMKYMAHGRRICVTVTDTMASHVLACIANVADAHASVVLLDRAEDHRPFFDAYGIKLSPLHSCFDENNIFFNSKIKGEDCGHLDLCPLDSLDEEDILQIFNTFTHNELCIQFMTHSD